jgi:hypothetical protein
VLDAASEHLGIRLEGVRALYGETIGDLAGVQHNADVAALREYLMSLVMENSRPVNRPWVTPPEDWYHR